MHRLLQLILYSNTCVQWQWHVIVDIIVEQSRDLCRVQSPDSSGSRLNLKSGRALACSPLGSRANWWTSSCNTARHLALEVRRLMHNAATCLPPDSAAHPYSRRSAHNSTSCPPVAAPPGALAGPTPRHRRYNNNSSSSSHGQRCHLQQRSRRSLQSRKEDRVRPKLRR